MSSTDDVSTPAEALRQIGTEEPPALELAEYLAAETDGDVVTAQDEIYAAIENGRLVETGEGYGGLRLAAEESETDVEEPGAEPPAEEPPAPPEQPPEEPASVDPEGGGKTVETAEVDPQEPAETASRDGDSDPTGYIDDPAFTGDEAAVREYYRSVRSVYDRFGDLDGAPTTGFLGNSGWYRYERDELGDGTKIVHRRPYTFERDFEELLDQLEYNADDTSWRSMYNLTSWKERDVVYETASVFAGEEFETGEGLAGYADMVGFPNWFDLDLADNDDGEEGPNYKARRGNLSAEHRETIEAAFEAYVEEFAELCGIEPSQVAILDSGGGAYVYTPASVTLLIAERYADDTGPYLDAKAVLFKQLRRRLHAYGTGTAVNQNADDYGFEGIETRVNDAVEGAAELLSPDWVQNQNRQSKAPLSLHGDHDIAVTPARPVEEPTEIEYTPTLVSEVDDEVIAQTEREVEKIVSVPPTEELEAMTETFVATLFPEYYADADGWRETLDTCLAEEREAEREAVHAAARSEYQQRHWLSERHSVETDDPAEVDSTEALKEIAVTPNHSAVVDALENPEIVDVAEVVGEYCSVPATSEECNASPADERTPWVTEDRGDELTFDANWRESNSGKSCAVPGRTLDRDSGEVVTATAQRGSETAPNHFVDNKCGGGGDPTMAYALGTGILPVSDDPTEKERKNAASQLKKLNGKRWLTVVDALRRDGYPIPIYVPEAGSEADDGTEYEQTPLWALRKAAVALGVCDRDDFVEREGENGGTYLGFESADDYNQTLRKLREREIDTGREPTRDLRSDYLEADLGEYSEEAEPDPYMEPEAMLRACLRARAAGAVAVETEPPTLALMALMEHVMGYEPRRDMSDATRELLVEAYHDIEEADLNDLLD